MHVHERTRIVQGLEDVWTRFTGIRETGPCNVKLLSTHLEDRNVVKCFSMGSIDGDCDFKCLVG